MKDRLLVIDFSGQIEAYAKDAQFIHIHNETRINGEQWLDLSIKDSNDYIIDMESVHYEMRGAPYKNINIKQGK